LNAVQRNPLRDNASEEDEMKRMLMLGVAAAAIGVLAMPAESFAQRGFGRGFGGGLGGGNYGGRGMSMGFGNTGYGNSYGGLGNNFYGSAGYGSGYGRGYYGSGYGNNYYGNGYSNSGYNNGYYSPNYTYSDPGAVSNYSFYPPDNSTGIVQTSASYAGAGNIVVYVPANAQLWWGNSATSTTGVERRFATSALSPQGEVNTFHAQWTDANGQMHNEARQVRAMPGQTVALDFRQPMQNAQPQQAVTPNQNVVPQQQNVVPNQNVVPQQNVTPNQNPIRNQNVQPNQTVPNTNLPNRPNTNVIPNQNVHPDDAPPQPFNR